MVEAARIPYNATRHPDIATPADVVREPEAGANCQLLVGALAHARGFELPYPRSLELMLDQDHTIEVPTIEDAQTGDIIALRHQKQQDPRFFHLGMLWITKEGVHIVHNSRERGEVRTERLDEVVQSPKYGIVGWIKRPNKTNPDLANPDFLRNYGLEHLI